MYKNTTKLTMNYKQTSFHCHQ